MEAGARRSGRTLHYQAQRLQEDPQLSKDTGVDFELTLHQDLYLTCTPRGKDAARGRAPLPTTRSDGRPTARALGGVDSDTGPDCPGQGRLWGASWEQRGSTYGVSERSCARVIYT